MKLRDLKLECPKPNVYVLSRVAETDTPLLMWNSKTVRVFCDAIAGKSDTIAINGASDSFKLGVHVARFKDKVKLYQVVDGVQKPVEAQSKVTLDRVLPAPATAPEGAANGQG